MGKFDEPAEPLEIRRLWGEDDPLIAYPSIDAAMHDDDQHDPLLAGYQSVSRSQAET